MAFQNICSFGVTPQTASDLLYELAFPLPVKGELSYCNAFSFALQLEQA
jgi:hypothetical protein